MVGAAGVVTTADTVQQRIRQGPAQVQTVLLNLQKRLDEQRLMSALKVCLFGRCNNLWTCRATCQRRCQDKRCLPCLCGQAAAQMWDLTAVP